MKKPIFVLSMALAIICAACVSCDGSLTGIMQKMGGNVFGLEADDSKVDAAQEKLDGSVEYKDGKAEIDWKQAASAASDVAGMIDSQQLKDKVAGKMQEPVSKDAGEAKKVSDAMKEQLASSAATVGIIAATDMTIPSSSRAALQAVGEALVAVRETIGDNPTKGDLATVAIINDLADKAYEAAFLAKAAGGEGDAAAEANERLNEMAMEVISSIYALKTISGSVSTIGSSLENLDIAVLLSEDKALDPIDLQDSEADEFGRKIAAAIDPVLRNFKGLMEENGIYSETETADLIRDMRAMRTAYEVFAMTANGTDATTIEEAVNSAISLIKGEAGYQLQSWARAEAGLTFDDIVYYAFSIVITEKPAELVHDRLSAYLAGASVKESIEGLTKLDGVTEAEEITFFNTAAVLVDASGWSETVCNLAGENLTAANILNVFHIH